MENISGLEAAMIAKGKALSTNVTGSKGSSEVECVIERVPLRSLQKAQRNPRTHSKKQIRQIAESMRRFGVLIH